MHKKLLRTLTVILLSLSALGLPSCSDELPPIGIKTQDFTACAGDEVQILGWGFSIVPAENIVKVEEVQAVVVMATRTALTVRLPYDVAGKITVEVKGNVAQGPVFTPAPPAYYVKFKANGVLKDFSVCLPVSSLGSTCVWGEAWRTEFNFASFQLCNDIEIVTPEVLESWNGDQLFFAGSKPIISFRYRENGGFEYHSEWAQTTGLGWPDNNSSLTITSLQEDSSISGKVYIAKGYFTCFVKATEAAGEIAITEGEFEVPIRLE